MKTKKMSMLRKVSLFIIIPIILGIILYIPGWFIYTRFCLDRYEMKDDTIRYEEIVYLRNDSINVSGEQNIGKTIGIGVYGKRSIADLIWPFWIYEYKNDKEHNRIFVRGLMDVGSVYEKVSEHY